MTKNHLQKLFSSLLNLALVQVHKLIDVFKINFKLLHGATKMYRP